MKYLKVSLPICILFLLIIFVQVGNCLKQNGVLVYPLDDTFIHFAIAKNLALHGIWGINPQEFVSASSSPFYVLLLSFCIQVFGYSLWIPLVINILCGIVLIFFSAKVLSSYLTNSQLLVYLSLIFLLIPLPSICITGMEHSLHLLFCTFFLFQTWKILKGEKTNLVVYSSVIVIAVMTRYESLFLIGGTGICFLFFQKKFKVFGILLFSALVPISIFGFFSILHGGSFFPNSMIIKSSATVGTFSAFLQQVNYKFTEVVVIYPLIFLIFIFVVASIKTGSKKIKENPALQLYFILLFTLISHTFFASFGWFNRYEAYLIGIILFSCALKFQDFQRMIKNEFRGNAISVMLFFVLLFLLPLFNRMDTVRISNKAMKNIHDQQYQMALFIKKYYSGKSVAVNDIGAVSLFGDAYILDITGLGNNEVFKNRKNKTAAFFDSNSKAKKVQLAMVYYNAIGSNIPKSWVKCGDWTLSINYVCGSSTVSIYAVDSTYDFREKLIHNLKEFDQQLPNTVIRSGEYLNTE